MFCHIPVAFFDLLRGAFFGFSLQVLRAFATTLTHGAPLLSFLTFCHGI
jgi:hypothetical protein